MTQLRPLLCATLLCAGLGCAQSPPTTSMDGGEPGVPEGRPVLVADFCTELTEIVCSANVTCCGGLTGGEESETCRTQQRESCDTSVAPLLEDPRTAYVPERGGAFLDALAERAEECFAEPPALSELLAVFEGTGAADADCTPVNVNDDGQLRVAQLSCVDGTTCHLYRRSDGTPMGVCEPREDGACSHRFDCRAGEWCNLPTDWEPGRWGDCRPLKAEGWGCSGDLECASRYCDSRGTCALPHDERYCAATTYEGSVRSHGPIGYWRLGDIAGGEARDESGHAFDGTLEGSPGAAEGALGDRDDGALALDGADDAVVLPAVGELLGDTLTMEVWFRRTAGSTTGPLLEFRDEDGDRGAHVWSHDAPDRAYVNFIDRGGDNHTIMSPEGTLEADTWYHVVATYDGSAGRLYVNGDRVGEVLMESFRPRTDGPLRIGLREGDERHVTGAIDEVAVYDYALGRAQIRQHRDRAVGPVPEPFVLFRWLR